eukprot:841075-Pyramimonas_sp.AAC.1
MRGDAALPDGLTSASLCLVFPSLGWLTHLLYNEYTIDALDRIEVALKVAAQKNECEQLSESAAGCVMEAILLSGCSEFRDCARRIKEPKRIGKILLSPELST